MDMYFTLKLKRIIGCNKICCNFEVSMYHSFERHLRNFHLTFKFSYLWNGSLLPSCIIFFQLRWRYHLFSFCNHGYIPAYISCPIFVNVLVGVSLPRSEMVIELFIMGAKHPSANASTHLSFFSCTAPTWNLNYNLFRIFFPFSCFEGFIVFFSHSTNIYFIHVTRAWNLNFINIVDIWLVIFRISWNSP